MISPTAAHAPQSAPQYRQELWEAMSWPHRTEGQKGIIVKTRIATYLPRLRVGASSEVTASAVSSLIPAPAPAMDMPPMMESQLSKGRGTEAGKQGLTVERKVTSSWGNGAYQ